MNKSLDKRVEQSKCFTLAHAQKQAKKTPIKVRGYFPLSCDPD